MKYNAFALIEIIVVAALIAFLSTITFIAISPSQNFQDVNSALRKQELLVIVNAIELYQLDNNGNFSLLRGQFPVPMYDISLANIRIDTGTC